MAKHLNDKVGSMEYDKLIAGITPPVKVASGIITKLSAAAGGKNRHLLPLPGRHPGVRTVLLGYLRHRRRRQAENPRHHRQLQRNPYPRLHSLR